MDANEFREIATQAAAQQRRDRDVAMEAAEAKVREQAFEAERAKAVLVIRELPCLLRAKAARGDRSADIYSVPAWWPAKAGSSEGLVRIFEYRRRTGLIGGLTSLMDRKGEWDYDVPDFSQTVFDECARTGLNPVWRLDKEPMLSGGPPTRYGPRHLVLNVRW